MKTSTEGLMALIGHEGIVRSRYKDSVGVWTLGIGHTAAAGSPDPRTFTDEMSIEQVFALLRKDIAKYEAGVNAAVKVSLKQHEFDALVSFHYNTGAIGKASLTKMLNAGDRAGAAKAFLNYSKPAEIIPRRKAEQALFRTGVYPAPFANVYPASAGGAVQWKKGERIDLRKHIKDTPQPTAPKPVETAPIRTDSILSRGSRGPIVSDLQANLNTLGYGPLKVDGHFGGETEKAVMSFQLDNGLKVDGIAGGRTSTAIGIAIKDRETAPKIAAAKDVVDDAASKGGISKTEVAAGVVAVSGAAKAADEIKTAVDSARGLTETLWSLGPWILVGLLTLAAGIYIYHDRRRKRIAADAAKEMM